MKQFKPRVYKVVLTGGPCGGKTTCQTRLSDFFENLGWKVLRVPETATVLLGGGILFSELTEKAANHFQEDLLKTIMQIETSFFRVAESLNRNVLVICDRGTMDASAFICPAAWTAILQRHDLNAVEIRDNRYDHVVHLVTAAIGAREYYSRANHAARCEDLEGAVTQDRRAMQAWIGHPYFDVIDNSTDFETKINRVINAVCLRLGVDIGDRLSVNSRKMKFLVGGPLPEADVFPKFQDFTVKHVYLQSSSGNTQTRIRKRGTEGQYTYTYTVRKPMRDQVVEIKKRVTKSDWYITKTYADPNNHPIYATRRCFIYNDQYFQLDIYREPCHNRCKGLILLETYTTLSSDEIKKRLPSFLQIVREVTGRPEYSMYNLSLKDENFAGAANSKVLTSGSGEGSDQAKAELEDIVKDCTVDISQLNLLTDCSSPEIELENEKKNEGEDKFDDELDKRYNWNRKIKEHHLNGVAG